MSEAVVKELSKHFLRESVERYTPIKISDLYNHKGYEESARPSEIYDDLREELDWKTWSYTNYGVSKFNNDALIFIECVIASQAYLSDKNVFIFFTHDGSFVLNFWNQANEWKSIVDYFNSHEYTKIVDIATVENFGIGRFKADFSSSKTSGHQDTRIQQSINLF